MATAEEALASLNLEWRKEIAVRLDVGRSYSSLVLVNGSRKGFSNIEIGTAVMLREKGRLFAITAEHCATDDMEITINRPEGTGHCTLRPIRVMRHPTLDLAIVEVRDVNCSAICLEQLRSPKMSITKAKTETEDGSIYWMIGYPACKADIDVHKNAVNIQLNCTGVQFLEMDDETIRVDYAKDALGFAADGTRPYVGFNPERPQGFSGGGLWALLSIREGAIFDPTQHMKQLGVIVSWYPESRRVNCIRSPKVKDLLFDSCPEFRPPNEE
jgi:hypothetical protein